MLTAFDISEQAGTDMLDYQQLVGLLEGYAKPRDRIGRLLAEGSLIRLRKGLYVLGERYRRAPVSRERLANLIYGPSCVSLEYALSLYGLIPERVANVTSVTTGQTRRFETPLGCFTYRNLSPVRYAPGIRWAGEGSERFLMAGPEKALVDTVWADKRPIPASLKSFTSYLFDDLRLEPERVAAMDHGLLAAIAKAFGSRKIDRLVRALTRGGEPEP